MVEKSAAALSFIKTDRSSNQTRNTRFSNLAFKSIQPSRSTAIGVTNLDTHPASEDPFEASLHTFFSLLSLDL